MNNRVGIDERVLVFGLLAAAMFLMPFFGTIMVLSANFAAERALGGVLLGVGLSVWVYLLFNWQE